MKNSKNIRVNLFQSCHPRAKSLYPQAVRDFYSRTHKASACQTLEGRSALLYIRSVRAILRGKFVVDSLHGVGVDKGILVSDGTIVDVGDFRNVARHAGGVAVRDYDGILCPALINAHTHLELAAMRNNMEHADFVDWVIKLVDKRLSMMAVDQFPDCSRAKADAESKGTCYFVNVGNDLELNSRLGANQLLAFEQIGINDSNAEKTFQRASEMLAGKDGVASALAVHAPYSVSPQLMKKIKSFNNGIGAVTSIHLSETSDEVEFVMSGTGRMADLLNYRVGKWEFSAPGVSPVKYVDSLGMLDEKTLCVHCVFINEEDIEIMRKREAAAAVCVRSNLELSGNVPPVGLLAKSGVKILIGTDSRASSPDIDMFGEIAAFYSQFREYMAPEKVFASATSEAAGFLGIGEDYGSISSGKKASIVFVPFEGNERDVFEYLVTDASGKTEMVQQ